MKLNRIKKLLEEFGSSDDEINIKKALSEEYLAISDYKRFASESKDPRVKKVLLSIASEEEAHAKELFELLKIIGISDEGEEGTEEVDNLLK
jgi:rubrerythrin